MGAATGYVNSPTFTNFQATTGTNPGSAPPDALSSVAAHYLKYDTSLWSTWSQLLTAATLYKTHGGPPSHGQINGIPALIGYEGAFSGTNVNGAIGHDIWYAPGDYPPYTGYEAVATAFLQSLQDGSPLAPGSGFAFHVQTGVVYGYNDPNQYWGQLHFNGQPAGDGRGNLYSTFQGQNLLAAPNKFSSAQAGSPGDGKPYDRANQSLSMQAMLDWTAGLTPSTSPIVVTLSATSVTATTATLNATVNPNGTDTSADFIYGTDPTLTTGTTTTTPQDVGSGSMAVAINAAISGLTGGTPYYFRVSATNTGGTTNGTILSFTTSAAPSAPVVVTQAASAITDTTATLNSTVNPEGASTSATFTYGTDPTLMSGTVTTTPQDAGSGSSPVPINAAITGLTMGTTYYFRISATNTHGTTDGTVLALVTGSVAPSATTTAATEITDTTVTLNGIVNPEGSDTLVTFVYGVDPTLMSGTTTTDLQDIGSGSSPVAIAVMVSGLVADTNYYFRVSGTNTGGTSEGMILTFLTTPEPPVLTVSIKLNPLRTQVVSVTASLNLDPRQTVVASLTNK